jgi:hypothetical protein
MIENNYTYTKVKIIEAHVVPEKFYTRYKPFAAEIQKSYLL